MQKVFISLALLLCTLLQGCGAIKLTYNNADTLLYWWLDGYVDFTLDQKPRAKDELLALQQWHRQTQLPVLVSLTQTLQKQVTGDVTPAMLCQNFDQAQALIPPLSSYLEPAVLWLATSLSTDQIQSITDKYAKTNKDWRKEWQPDTKQALIKASEKFLRERIDPIYGKLSDAQLVLLRAAIAASPFDPAIAYAERLRRQQDLLGTLKQIQSKQLSTEAAKEPMRALLARNQDSPDAAYRAYAQRIKLHYCDLFSQLHNSMTAEQRTYALGQFQGYERDFKTLQAAR
jgi:Family of unknown function (DUF6279)